MKVQFLNKQLELLKMKKSKNSLKQRTMNLLKKGVLVLSLLFIGNTTINAQSDTTTIFGIKGGVNLSKINNGKNKLGMAIGAYAEFKISDKFSIQPELLYSKQGAKFGSNKLKLNYINVPVLAKFSLINKISIEAGPQVGYLLSKSEGTLAKSNYKKLDLSAVIGLNYQISKTIGIGARYNLGLKDITKAPGKHKNKVFQFLLSYRF